MKSFLNFRLQGRLLLMVAFTTMIFFSCKRDEKKPDETLSAITGKRQTFVLTLSLDKKDEGKFKSIVETDLMSVANDMLDVSNLKVLRSQSSHEHVDYVAIVELKNSDMKNIMINSSGEVVRWDVSKFFSSDAQEGTSFKNLLALKAIVKKYQLKAYDVSKEFSFSRESMGFASAEK